jgi:hypothetical protein
VARRTFDVEGGGSLDFMSSCMLKYLTVVVFDVSGSWMRYEQHLHPSHRSYYFILHYNKGTRAKGSF